MIPSTGLHAGEKEPQSVGFRRLSEKQLFVVTAGRRLLSISAAFLPMTKPENFVADHITAAGIFQRRSNPVKKALFN